MRKRARKLRRGKLPFKPRARMLLLLGDQLIRDAGIAVFELVKNSYDADSPYARVTMTGIENPKTGQITVEDSGSGMDYDTVVNVWLEPGTDNRVVQRAAGERTPKYNRLPLGEKGVGRFAAHKLGRHVKLVTHRRGHPEIVVDIDWREFGKHKYLEDVPVEIYERTAEVFRGRRTGTLIEVSALRNTWSRGMVRDLSRSITSICSPFEQDEDTDSFATELVLPEHKDWIKGLLSVDEILEFALFRASCSIANGKLSYDYCFSPPKAMTKVKKRKFSATVNLPLDGEFLTAIRDEVGPVHIDLHVFDREPRILALGVTDKKGLKEFLNAAGGIRVYRDGIRVYDYGEPGNDWLNLGGLRVNRPTQRISNNIVVGAVSIALEASADLSTDDEKGLIEKTNREGFVDNGAYRAFKEAVYFAVTQIEAERNKDKTRIRNAYSSKKMREPVLEDLTELKQIVEKKGLEEELGPYVDRIEADFRVIRDRFLTSASAGLSLSVVIHEVEKGVQELQLAVEREKASPRVRRLAKHLADLIEGFASLIRKSGATREKASRLISHALFNTDLRLKLHGISTSDGKGTKDFEAKCSKRLTVATLMNLIDNSIWWLDNKWGKGKKRGKNLYLGISRDLSGGPAILIADNGPGFMDPPEYLVEPFISRKPDGMGLGLHIADQVMKAQGGRVEFPQRGDVKLPAGLRGAVVALVFGGEQT